MSPEEELPCLFVRSYALKKGEYVACLVRGLSVKIRRGKLRVDCYYFLEKRGHGAN